MFPVCNTSPSIRLLSLFGGLNFQDERDGEDENYCKEIHAGLRHWRANNRGAVGGTGQWRLVVEQVSQTDTLLANVTLGSEKPHFPITLASWPLLQCMLMPERTKLNCCRKLQPEQHLSNTCFCFDSHDLDEVNGKSVANRGDDCKPGAAEYEAASLIKESGNSTKNGLW